MASRASCFAPGQMARVKFALTKYLRPFFILSYIFFSSLFLSFFISFFSFLISHYIARALARGTEMIVMLLCTMSVQLQRAKTELNNNWE